MTPILPSRHDDKVFKKQVQRDKEAAATGQTEGPIAHPASTVTTTFVTTTSGTFQSIWQSRIDSMVHRGLVCRAAAGGATDTSGELRLIVQRSGYSDVISGVRSFPTGGGLYTLEWRWLPDMPIPWLDPFYVRLQARRTAGTGTVSVYEPEGGFQQVHARNCTDTGL
jgi:hypothetical protein